MNKYLDRKHMAEDLPNVKAVRRFRTPAYEAARMIRAQGEQIGDTAEYLAEKYGIRGDADGEHRREDSNE